MLCISCAGKLQAQGKPFLRLFGKKPIFDEVGFQTGFGYETASNRVPEGVYRPTYLMAHLANHFLTDSARKNAWGVPLFYAEPQINPVWVQLPDGSMQLEWEFGINNGLKHTLQIHPKAALFIFVGSGPHFFTMRTQNQQRGFIFSDCFGAGVQIWLSSKSSFNANFRIRHMSNLEIMQPNSGINTYNFHWGWSWWLD